MSNGNIINRTEGISNDLLNQRKMAQVVLANPEFTTSGLDS
ncbi:hypothetical protein [Listeria monocytogenes]|nr:hypothetical protein [Listeria monocytogenes]